MRSVSFGAVVLDCFALARVAVALMAVVYRAFPESFPRMKQRQWKTVDLFGGLPLARGLLAPLFRVSPFIFRGPFL
jgi:hypothetical protein